MRGKTTLKSLPYFTGSNITLQNIYKISLFYPLNYRAARKPLPVWGIAIPDGRAGAAEIVMDVSRWLSALNSGFPGKQAEI
jgi:hypothetical protein